MSKIASGKERSEGTEGTYNGALEERFEPSNTPMNIIRSGSCMQDLVDMMETGQGLVSALVLALKAENFDSAPVLEMGCHFL